MITGVNIRGNWARDRQELYIYCNYSVILKLVPNKKFILKTHIVLSDTRCLSLPQPLIWHTA